MRRYLMLTETERQSTLGAMNLFFGALLGANLGSYAELPMKTYVWVIVLITGAVASLQVALRSERRVYAWTTVGLYVVLLAFSLRPQFWPDAARPPGYDKLLVTMTAWLIAAVGVKASPVLPSAPPTTTEDLDLD